MRNRKEKKEKKVKVGNNKGSKKRGGVEEGMKGNKVSNSLEISSRRKYFYDEKIKQAYFLIDKMWEDKELVSAVSTFNEKACLYLYSYNFSWLGRPIIQFPQDIVAVQEIIWEVKPDFVIETGVAHGGGLMLYASVLEIIGKGKVIGIDVEIRKHNFREIMSHPLSHRIILLEGSSTDERIFEKVKELCAGKNNIVILDSLHTHEHVLRELELYSQLVRKGGYIIVFDTIIEFLPDELFKDKPWGKGNNPKTAVDEFLKRNKRFEVDYEIERKLLITTCPGGYLKCVL